MAHWIRGHHGLSDGRLEIMRAPVPRINFPTQTNPNYQFVKALYSSLALFETTNRVLQLVENTLIASLITKGRRFKSYPATT